ncbi:MAG: CoA transferase, partial [Chloroflexi bacterium]|nr:CoA transferase [Chloroflexota bacterium]
GQAVAHRLIAKADIVCQNLRVGTADRIGFDYETVRRINPRVIYCHTNGYGITGPRAKWPGLDQLFQAMCGVEYEGGGVQHGNTPIWYRFGMCDTGNAMQSVVAVLQALYHRDKSGEGQFVTTNLLNCGLLYNSDYFEAERLEGPSRPEIDKAQTGLSPLYRLYQTQRGWLAIAVVTDAHWRALCRAIGKADLASDTRFASHESRNANRDSLASILEGLFSQRRAEHWFAILDASGVPCEISDEQRGQRIFADTEALEAGWFGSQEHPGWGRIHQHGQLIDLSDTPGQLGGPPPLVGQHTKAIMAELGYSEAEMQALKAKGAVTWP